MKMKRILTILLALMLVAVCGCAKQEEKKPVVDDAPKYTVREGFVTDLEDVNSLEYTNGEKTISMEIYDGAWFQKDDNETWINQTIIMNIVKTAGQMAYIEEVKDVKSLADYGLENPAYTITMKNEDGFVVSLYIGNAEGEEECYVAVDDKKAVYKVSNAIIGMLEFDQEKLLAVEVDPMEYLKYMEDETINADEGVLVDDDVIIPDDTAGQNPSDITDDNVVPEQDNQEQNQNQEQE